MFCERREEWMSNVDFHNRIWVHPLYLQDAPWTVVGSGLPMQNPSPALHGLTSSPPAKASGCPMIEEKRMFPIVARVNTESCKECKNR